MAGERRSPALVLRLIFSSLAQGKMLSAGDENDEHLLPFLLINVDEENSSLLSCYLCILCKWFNHRHYCVYCVIIPSDFFYIRSGDFKSCSCQRFCFWLTLRRKELPEILFCSFRHLFLALSEHLGNSGRIQCFKRKRVIEGDE